MTYDVIGVPVAQAGRLAGPEHGALDLMLKQNEVHQQMLEVSLDGLSSKR